ncbi:MAG: S-layer family protein, partial [Comamonadaceae bacterium]
YTFTGGTQTAGITQATLSVTAPVVTKTYDGGTTATGAATVGALAGAGAGETVGTAATLAFTDKHVGSGNKTVHAGGLSIKDSGNADVTSNYNISYVDNAASTVSAKTVTLSASKTYDGSTSLTGAVTVGTGISGEALTYTGATVNDSTVAAANKFIDAITLANGTGGLASNYQLPTLNNSNAPATITAAVVTVIGLSGSRAYDGTANMDAAVFSTFGGLIGAQTLTLTGSGTVADKNVAANKPVTLGTLTLGNGSNGGLASNYTLTGGTHTASITRLNSVTWTGGVTGNWFDPANWGGAVPDRANVANVIIPTGTTVSFNNATVVSPVVAGGSVSVDSISAAGTGGLSMSAGTLAVANNLTLGDYSQSGGSVTGAGGLTVGNSFNQSGGSLNISGQLNITQASGTMTLGALSAGSVALAGSANVAQGGAITTGLLSANLTSGSLALNAASNVITKLGAITAPGGFALTNGNTALTVDGNLTTSNAAISIDTGTATYTHNADRDIASGSGNITITADNVVLAANSGNNAFSSTGTLSLQPKTASKAVSLGGGVAAGAWGLSNTEIGYFTTGQAGPIVIGRSDSSGLMNMDDSANFTGRNVTLNAGMIWQSSGKLLTADAVQLNAVTAGTGQGSYDGRIGTYWTALSVTANRLGINTNNAKAFINTGGATTISGATLGTGILYLGLGGDLTQDGAITAQSLSLNGMKKGSAVLTHAGNNIDILGAQLYAGSALNYADSNGFATGTIANGRTGAVADQGVTLSAGGAGNLTIGTTGASGNIVNAGSSLVTLSSGSGNVTQTSTAAIAGGSLKVTTSGAGGVTLDSNNNNVSTVAGVAGSGGFSYSSFAALTIGTVGGISGIDTSAGNGAIILNEFASSALNVTGNIKAGSSIVSLLGGSSITATGSIQAGSLRVAGGAATLSNTNNHVGTLAATMSNKNLAYVDSGDFAVGTVGASTGITMGTGRLTLTSNAAGGKITVSQAISSWGSTFTADDFDASANVSAQGGILWLRPYTADRAIDLGTDTAGTLGISTADYSKLASTSEIKFGRNAADGTASGAMTLSGALSTPTGTAFTLNSGGAISTTGSGAITGTSSLSVNGNDSIALTGANDRSHVNLNSTGIGKAVSYNDINDITASTLITKGNVAVSAGGNIYVSYGASLTNGVLTLTSSGGNITQGIRGITATALEANTSGTGGVTLNSTNNYTPLVAGTAGSGGFNFYNSAALSAGTAGATSGINTSAANGAITLDSGSQVTIAQPLNAGTGTIALSGGTIIATAASITGGGLSLLGRSGSVTVNHASNNVSTLAASLLYTNANLTYADSNGFTVGTVGSTVGIATKGDINLTAAGAGSLLTVERSISNGSSARAINLIADDLEASAAINAGSGTLWLTPYTAGREIDLGSNTAGKLGISTTDFSQMATTGKLIIGREGSVSVGSGAMSISNAINRTGRLSLRSAGTITQSAALAATTLEIVANDSVTLTNAANNTNSLVIGITGDNKSAAWTDADSVMVTSIGNYHSGSSVAITAAANGGTGNLTLAGGIGSGTVSLVNAGTGNLVLNAESSIYAYANGNGGTANTVVLAAGSGTGAFINNASAIRMSGTNSPRWLVYANSPDSPNLLNKLASGSEALFSKTYASYAPGSVTEAGNRYIFASAAPTNSGSTITFTSIDATKTYGDVSTLGSANYKWFAYSNGGTARPEFSTPLNPGVTLTGTPTVSSTGSSGTANVGNYGVSLDLTGVSVAGYTLVANNTGLLGVTQRAVTIDSATAANKVYDGTTTATLGSFVLGNVVNGDTVSMSTPMSATFADKNVGSSKTVTATLGTGALSNSNYMLPTSGIATFSADITARALTLTLTAADRVYDGTTGATATVTGDNRIAGDDLSYALGSASFATKIVGAGKTATVSGIALTGGLDLGNYSLANSATTTASITKATLMLDNAIGSKTYDGTTELATPTWTLSGLIGSDAVTASGAASFLDKNAGTGKLLTASLASLTLADTDAGNYTLGTGTFTGGSGTITPRSLTVSATGVNKVYDAATAATATLSSDKVAGDDLALSYAPLAFGNKNVGDGKALSLTGIAFAGGADAGNYTLAGTTASTNANITAATLSLAMISGSKVYDGATALATPSYGLSGVLGSDTVAVSGAATFGDKNAGADKTLSVNLASLSVGGADGGNYTLGTGSWNGGSGTITPKSISYSGGTGIDKTYDGSTTVAAGYTLGSLTGIVGSDTASLVGRPIYASANAGSVAVQQGSVALSGAEAGNYALAWTSGSGTIAKAALTVAVNSDAKFITQSDTAGYNGINYSGFVNSETSSVLGGVVAIARSNSGVDSAGIYSGVLSATGLTADNYSISYGAGDFTIVPASQLLIKAGNASTTYGTGASHSLSSVAYYNGVNVRTLTQTAQSGNTFTYDDGASGTATFTLSATGATSTSGNLRVGSYATGGSSFSQTGSNFNGTPTYIGNLAVTPLAATLGAASVSKTYDGNTSLSGATITVGNKLGSDVIAVSGSGAFDSKNANTSAGFTVSGLTLSGTDAANYALSSSTLAGTGSIAQKALSVNYTGASKVYDATTAATVNGVSADIVAGDSVGFSQTADFVSKAVGTSKAINISGITLGSTDAANYALAATTATTSANITARALTVSYAADGKVYDGTTSVTATGSSGGVLEGDTVSFSQSAAFGNKNAGLAKTVNITSVALGGADGGNYSVSNPSTTSTATITPKTVSLTASKGYDGTLDLAGAVTIGTGIAGEALNYSGATASDAHVSTAAKFINAITLIDSTGSASNYALPALDVSNAPVTITAAMLTPTLNNTAVTKVYDGGSNAPSGFTPTYSVTGFVSGDTAATMTFGSASYDNVTVAAASKIAVAGLAISGITGTGLASDYVLDASSKDIAATISKAPLSVSASNASKSYDGVAYVGGNGVSYSGFVNNETSSVLAGTLGYAGS